MIEQRQFHRVRMTETCDLTYHDTPYPGQLDNISLSGAVVSFSGEVPIPLGAICTLRVYLKADPTPLEVNVEIIHSNLSLIGVRFVPLDSCGQNRLVGLVEKFTVEPDKLTSELDHLKWQLVKYLRAS